MTEHLSTEIVERFHHHALAPGDRTAIYDHVLKCNACRERIVDSSSEPLALQALSDHLVTSNYDEPFHLDSELVEAYVEDNLDEIDRERTEMHLQRCIDCSAEVSDFRESLATMRAASLRRPLEESQRETLPAFIKLPRFSSLHRIAAIAALATLALIALFVVWRFRSSGPTPSNENKLSAESKPPPIQSPSVAVVTHSPSPSSGRSPKKFVEQTPNQGSDKSTQSAVVLNDGSARVRLDRAGNLSGLESLPNELQQAVRQTLVDGEIKKPKVLDEIATGDVALRGSGNEERVTLDYPANRVVAEDQPLFTWNPSKTAEAYSVEVGDSGFRQVARSETLPPTSRSWKPPLPLKRGEIYTWTVRAVIKGDQTSTLPAKFKVLESDKLKQLNQLKSAPQSHLALGLFYAREGMIVEAEREFQALVRANPRSQHAIKLLREIQSWQRH